MDGAAMIAGAVKQASASEAKGAASGSDSHVAQLATPRTFALGWQVADLYQHAPSSVEHGAGKDSERLPGTGRLKHGEQTRLGVQEITATLNLLSSQFTAAGIDAPSSAEVQDAVTGGTGEVREKIRLLHVKIFTGLSAVDFRLGKSYGLGRALFDTCDVKDEAELRERFEKHRVIQIQEWLADLASALPAHAGRSVSLSLERWQSCVEGRDESSWEDEIAGVLRALTRQGHLWRALLSDEKCGTDMLSAEKYAEAADRLVTQGRQVSWGLLKHYGGILLFMAALTIGGVVAALTLPGAAQVVAALGVAAAALGISWKGIGTALGHLADKLSKPLWQAELDQAVAEAITVLPKVAEPTIDISAVSPAGPSVLT